MRIAITVGSSEIAEQLGQNEAKRLILDVDLMQASTEFTEEVIKALIESLLCEYMNDKDYQGLVEAMQALVKEIG